jgi:hypothetical protein
MKESKLLADFSNMSMSWKEHGRIWDNNENRGAGPVEKSKSERMLPVSTLLLSSGLLVYVAATIPTYNVKPTCRAAIALSAVTGRTVEMCEASEAQARNEVIKAWSTFTEATKDRCLKTSAHHAPSYVELLICLESMRDMQKRQEQEQPPGKRPR